MAKSSTPVEDRFWDKVDKRGPEDCWIWTGSLTRSGGYGQISRTRSEGPVRANRVSYEMAYGSFDPSLCVLHRCDTPACVNPSHLFLGTRADNAMDKARKGRIKSSKLTPEIVRQLRQSSKSGQVLSQEFGVSRTTVNRAISRKTWSHVHDPN